EVDVHPTHPWCPAPAFDLRHRFLDVAGVRADHRLEPMGVFAAEVVQKAMLRPHELDVDLTVLVAARPAIVDQELDVDPLLVHVTDASVGVPVIAVEVRSLGPHEPTGGPAGRGARLRLAERARDVRSPPADGCAAAQ